MSEAPLNWPNWIGGGDDRDEERRSYCDRLCEDELGAGRDFVQYSSSHRTSSSKRLGERPAVKH